MGKDSKKLNKAAQAAEAAYIHWLNSLQRYYDGRSYAVACIGSGLCRNTLESSIKGETAISLETFFLTLGVLQVTPLKFAYDRDPDSLGDLLLDENLYKFVVNEKVPWGYDIVPSVPLQILLHNAWERKKNKK